MTPLPAFPKRMEKELGDGRGGPWWHRLSNAFWQLSLNKWVIGWPNRAAPSSQPGPFSPSLVLTHFMAAPKPHGWSWRPVPAPQTNRGWVGDLPHVACLKLRHQERRFVLRQQKWKQTSSRLLAGEQTCSYIISAPLLSAMWKSKTLPDSTGSHLILKTGVKRSLWQYCSLKLQQPPCVPAGSTFQEMTFAVGVHILAH